MTLSLCSDTSTSACTSTSAVAVTLAVAVTRVVAVSATVACGAPASVSVRPVSSKRRWSRAPSSNVSALSAPSVPISSVAFFPSDAGKSATFVVRLAAARKSAVNSTSRWLSKRATFGSVSTSKSASASTRPLVPRPESPPIATVVKPLTPVRRLLRVVAALRASLVTSPLMLRPPYMAIWLPASGAAASENASRKK